VGPGAGVDGVAKKNPAFPVIKPGHLARRRVTTLDPIQHSSSSNGSCGATGGSSVGGLA
jgi:hypothetical protein